MSTPKKPPKPATGPGKKTAPAPGAKGNDKPADGAKPKADAPHPDPTRYGDWEKKGRCIDF